MNQKQAVKKVEELLKRYWKEKTSYSEVSIYSWNGKERYVGIRVAEVSFSSINPETHCGSGSSFMQVDLDNATQCFFAERAILSHLLYPEDLEEQFGDLWRLIYSVFGEDVAAEFTIDWYAEHPLAEEK